MVKLMCLWATLGCGAAWAQSDGFIEGTVTEEAGEALPGANIAVRSPVEDYQAGTTADADGQFRIAVPAGNYQVEIAFVGYKSDLRENVQVQAGQTTRLDAVLVEQVIFLAQSVVSASRRQEKILDAPASVSVVEVDSYTVLDLNLTYRLPIEQDLVLQVDADNVLDQAYQSFVGAPAVGRLVFGQVGLRF